MQIQASCQLPWNAFNKKKSQAYRLQTDSSHSFYTTYED